MSGDAKKKVVVIGGGIAGALLAKIVQNKADVYLIDPYGIAPSLSFVLRFIDESWHFISWAESKFES